MLNSDLLALPEREQQAWIHGAVTTIIAIRSTEQSVQATCFNRWYFEGTEGAEMIPQFLARYKDSSPSATILAVAKKVCPKG